MTCRYNHRPLIATVLVDVTLGGMLHGSYMSPLFKNTNTKLYKYIPTAWLQSKLANFFPSCHFLNYSN